MTSLPFSCSVSHPDWDTQNQNQENSEFKTASLSYIYRLLKNMRKSWFSMIYTLNFHQHHSSLEELCKKNCTDIRNYQSWDTEVLKVTHTQHLTQSIVLVKLQTVHIILINPKDPTPALQLSPSWRQIVSPTLPSVLPWWLTSEREPFSSGSALS